MDLHIKIDTRQKGARQFFELLKNLPFIKVQQPKSAKRYNSETEEAINEVREGRAVYKAKNSNDLFKSLGV